MKNKILLAAAALIALVSGLVVQHLTVGATEKQSLPEINLPDTADVRHSLEEWQGKVLVINFWATWCPPCREEIPEFINLQRELGGKGLQFIGIAIEGKETAEEFAHMMDVNYPVLIAEDQGIALSMQLGNVIGALPYSVVVDRNGRIVHTQPGTFRREEVLEVVSPLL